MRKLVVICAGLVICATGAAAAEIRVPADYETIQEALDTAGDGDTVLVAPGEYVITEPLDFNRLHDWVLGRRVEQMRAAIRRASWAQAA